MLTDFHNYCTLYTLTDLVSNVVLCQQRKRQR